MEKLLKIIYDVEVMNENNNIKLNWYNNWEMATLEKFNISR
jgi:hypothetical protein